MVSCSVYVPAQTWMVAPGVAAARAALMEVYPALAQLDPGALADATGDTHSPDDPAAPAPVAGRSAVDVTTVRVTAARPSPRRSLGGHALTDLGPGPEGAALRSRPAERCPTRATTPRHSVRLISALQPLAA